MIACRQIKRHAACAKDIQLFIHSWFRRTAEVTLRNKSSRKIIQRSKKLSYFVV